jgi:hypothetical protein
MWKNTKFAGGCDMCATTAAKSRLVWRIRGGRNGGIGESKALLVG